MAPYLRLYYVIIRQPLIAIMFNSQNIRPMTRCALLCVTAATVYSRHVIISTDPTVHNCSCGTIFNIRKLNVHITETLYSNHISHYLLILTYLTPREQRAHLISMYKPCPGDIPKKIRPHLWLSHNRQKNHTIGHTLTLFQFTLMNELKKQTYKRYVLLYCIESSAVEWLPYDWSFHSIEIMIRWSNLSH